MMNVGGREFACVIWRFDPPAGYSGRLMPLPAPAEPSVQLRRGNAQHVPAGKPLEGGLRVTEPRPDSALSGTSGAPTSSGSIRSAAFLSSARRLCGSATRMPICFTANKPASRALQDRRWWNPAFRTASRRRGRSTTTSGEADGPKRVADTAGTRDDARLPAKARCVEPRTFLFLSSRNEAMAWRVRPASGP